MTVTLFLASSPFLVGRALFFFFFLDSWIDFRKINYTACRHLSFMMQIDHFIFI
jgi:hypothetical protein